MTTTTASAPTGTSEYSDEEVLACFISHSVKIQEQLKTLKDTMEILGKAAGMAKLYGSQEDYDEAHGAALKIVEQHRELKFVLDAMVYLGSKGNARPYQIGENSTDFATLIEETVLTLKTEEGKAFSAENHSLMEVFNKYKNDAAQTEDRGREIIDDDIQIEGGVGITKNTKCPLTMKDVIDLKEPVEDAKGFVYEKDALEAYIKGKTKGRKGKILSPIAETNHYITLSELKPCSAIIEAQKRRA